jgi:hypothetical protein
MYILYHKYAVTRSVLQGQGDSSSPAPKARTSSETFEVIWSLWCRTVGRVVGRGRRSGYNMLNGRLTGVGIGSGLGADDGLLERRPEWKCDIRFPLLFSSGYLSQISFLWDLGRHRTCGYAGVRDGFTVPILAPCGRPHDFDEVSASNRYTLTQRASKPGNSPTGMCGNVQPDNISRADIWGWAANGASRR